MKRSGPLSRLTPLHRKQGIRKRNRARLAKRRSEQFGAHADAIRQLPCSVCGKRGPSDPHHVRSRGAGGKADVLVPLCRRDHDLLHQIGRVSFEKRYNVDLEATARRLAGEEQ